jgi:hypothetical protein
MDVVHQRFGNYVTSIDMLEVGRTHKVMDFPLGSAPEYSARDAENG